MGKFGSLSSSSSGSTTSSSNEPPSRKGKTADRTIVSGTTGKAWKPVELVASSPPPKRCGKKKPPATDDTDQQPDKASTDVSSDSSESETDQDMLKRILYSDSMSHQTEEQEDMTESMQMRAILYGSPGDDPSNSSSGWDSGAEDKGNGDKDNSRGDSDHSRGRSSRSSASRSRSQSSGGSGSRSRSVSRSHSHSSGSRGSQYSRSQSGNGDSRSRSYSGGSQSGSESGSQGSRSRSNGSESGSQASRSRSNGSQSGSQGSKSPSNTSRSRSKSSRSRSASSRSPSDPPESKTSLLHKSDGSQLDERGSVPSHSGSIDKSSDSATPASQQSVNVGSHSESKTSRSGSDPPESKAQHLSPSQRSRSSSRSHPWNSPQSKSNRYGTLQSGSVSRKRDVENSASNLSSKSRSDRANNPGEMATPDEIGDDSLALKSPDRDEKPHSDSRDLNDSSKGMSVLQRLEERRRAQGLQDSSKKLEGTPKLQDPVENGSAGKKERKETSSPGREKNSLSTVPTKPADVKQSAERGISESTTPGAVEHDGRDEGQVIKEVRAALIPSARDVVQAGSSHALNDESKKEGGTESVDNHHKLVVHDNDDWKPPALTTYGEVRYIPTHQYESRRDPDAKEPAAGPAAPIVEADTPPKQSRKSLKDAPPPIPEVTVIPSADDESTLGLYGEYLDRFPQKNTKKPPAVADVSTPAIAAITNEVPQYRAETMLQPTPLPVPRSIFESTPPVQTTLHASPKLKSALKPARSEYDKSKSWVQANFARPPKENDAMDDYYKSWIRPGSMGGKTSDRLDPPADVNLFPFNPKNPLEAKVIQEEDLESSFRDSPMYASVNIAALRSSTWVPVWNRKEVDAGDSIPSFPQYFKSEGSLNSTWAAPGSSKRQDKYDHEMESRRLYIESIIAQKRPISRDRNRVTSRSRQAARVDFTGAINASSPSPKSSSSSPRSSSTSGSRSIPSENESSSSSSQPSTSTESMFLSERSDASSNPRTLVAPTSLLGKMTSASETSHSVHVEDDSGTSHTNEAENSSPGSSKEASESSHDIEVVDESSSIRQSRATDDEHNPDNPPRTDYTGPSTTQREPRKQLAPPMSRAMVIFFILFCLVALGGIGVAIYFMVPQFRQDENPAPPTAAPTPQSSLDTSLEGLQDFIISKSPETEASFNDPSSPQSLALDWLSENTFLSSYSSDQILQRFVMATLYFSTGGESWERDELWLSNVSECEWYSSETDIQVCRPDGRLDELDLKRNNLLGSLPWNELAILKSQLVIFDVFSNQVSGSISAGVGELTSLRALDLQDNRISGTLPGALWRLTNMRHLVLADNSIGGSLSQSLSQLTDLVTLNLRRNSLTGSIPTSIGELSNLRNVLLDGNNLDGSIPEQLCEMNLEKLVVDCDLVSCSCCTCSSGSAPSPDTPTQPTAPPVQSPSGSPPTVGTPTTGTNLLNLITDAFPESEEALQDLNSPQSQALVWLESSDNNGVSSEEQLLQRYALAVLYYASIGDEWTNNDSWLTSADECSWWSNVNTQDMCDSLGRYVAVDLAGNNLQGSIPPELAILSNSLSIVSMSSNELGGELPSALFDMTNLRQLTLFENRLVGSLSSHVGQLTRLESLDVGGNQLTGTLPSSLGQMQRLAGLSVYGNSFTGVIPSSLGDLDSLQLLYADSNNLRGPFPTDLCLLNLREFWSDCEETQCVCCTTCCNDGFGCVET